MFCNWHSSLCIKPLHVFSLQVLLSMSPRDILLITLNHMDAVRKFVEGNDHVMELVNNVYKLLYQVICCVLWDFRKEIIYSSLTDTFKFKIYHISPISLYFLSPPPLRISPNSTTTPPKQAPTHFRTYYHSLLIPTTMKTSIYVTDYVVYISIENECCL